MDRRVQHPPIFRLPPEILVHALAQATPKACAAFGRTCSLAHALVKSAALWRALHSAHWDDPSPSLAPGADAALYDHAMHVQRRTRAETLVCAFVERSEPFPPAHLEPLLETLVDLAESRPPCSTYETSRNERWLEQWLTSTPGGGEVLLALHPTFSRSSSRSLRSTAQASTAAKGKASLSAILSAARTAQLAAHLHVLSTPCPLALSSPSLRTAAKEIVYERLNALRGSYYGPLMNDGSGRVDWRKVEALQMVMRANLDDAAAIGWGRETVDARGNVVEDDDPAVVPTGWRSTRPGAIPTRQDPDGRDWAGVTHEGGLRGTYAFVHYPVFIHFNHHRGGPFQPTLAGEHEAVGDCMAIRLELLPEGEWPEEIDQPDLSNEALGREDVDDDEEDGDWESGEGEGSDGSGSSDESSEAEVGYFTTTVVEEVEEPVSPSRRSDRGHAAGPSGADGDPSPPTSPPDGGDEDGDSPLSASQLAALSSPSALGALPAAPLSPKSPLYPAMPYTFRPSDPSAPTSSASVVAPNPAYPRLAFRGVFNNVAPPGIGAMRTIRGTVELTPDGHVRWQMLIRYSGQDQWYMSGVQLGGPGSTAGILGMWSSADRAEEGPCGPFWYWPHLSPEGQTA
ncbi:F-box protein [Rhodotorula paludigena]|uniref:F-box protein n=1 Tax=Rhodotorula paludigena TaxID=86838 RepID=UPI0031806FE8